MMGIVQARLIYRFAVARTSNEDARSADFAATGTSFGSRTFIASSHAKQRSDVTEARLTFALG